MNIQSLMSRPAPSLPSVGSRCVIREWDDTIEEVRIVRADSRVVVMEYSDGVQHRVPPEYFQEHVHRPVLLEFSTTQRWWDHLWGGGHTAETDPTRRGWRARPVKKGSDVLLIGRPGVKGCFTALPMGDRVDVATYDDRTPKEVQDDEKRVGDAFRVVPCVPGWILPFILDIERNS